MLRVYAAYFWAGRISVIEQPSPLQDIQFLYQIRLLLLVNPSVKTKVGRVKVFIPAGRIIEGSLLK